MLLDVRDSLLSPNYNLKMQAVALQAGSELQGSCQHLPCLRVKSSPRSATAVFSVNLHEGDGRQRSLRSAGCAPTQAPLKGWSLGSLNLLISELENMTSRGSVNVNDQ